MDVFELSNISWLLSTTFGNLLMLTELGPINESLDNVGGVIVVVGNCSLELLFTGSAKYPLTSDVTLAGELTAFICPRETGKETFLWWWLFLMFVELSVGVTIIGEVWGCCNCLCCCGDNYLDWSWFVVVGGSYVKEGFGEKE